MSPRRGHAARDATTLPWPPVEQAQQGQQGQLWRGPAYTRWAEGQQNPCWRLQDVHYLRLLRARGQETSRARHEQ